VCGRPGRRACGHPDRAAETTVRRGHRGVTGARTRQHRRPSVGAGIRLSPLGMARDRMPDDVEPSQAELLRVEARHEGAGAIVMVDGELDYSTTERFVACILEAFDTKPRSITVDLHGVTSSDSSGLAALLRARDLAFADQVAFRIQDPSPRLRRLLELTATKDLLMPDE
jgi:anti-anti-sigma factor